MMEYKKNGQRNPPLSTTSHFTESNAGHISVQTTSPFLNKVKDSDYKIVGQNQYKSNKNFSTSVLGEQKFPKDISSGTSKLLINQILGDNLDKEMIINLNKSYTEKSLNIEKQSNYNQNILINKVEFKYSTPTFNSKSFSMQRGSCSRDDSIVTSRTTEDSENKSYKINNDTYFKTALNEKKFAEKTTYCRPSYSYNQEFITKTMERNNRLKRLVKKLILVRKKEKQTEAWNNYINELKSKHRHCDMELNRIIGRHTLEEPTPLQYIDDYYDNQSDPCKDLLQDFYDVYNTMQFNSSSYEVDSHNPQINKSSLRHNYTSYFNQSNCYPMSSQGRLMMLNRERRKHSLTSNYQNYPPRRPVYGNVIIVDKEPRVRKPVARTRCFCACENDEAQAPRENAGAQTEIMIVKPIDQSINKPRKASNTAVKLKAYKAVETNTEEEKGTVKDEYTRVSENVERLKKKMNETSSCNRDPVLQSIEKKLDNLITSINSFIDELKSRTHVRQCYECHSVCLDLPKPGNHKMNVTRSDTYGLKNAEKLVCGIITEDSSSPSSSGMDRKLIEKSRATNIDRILIADIDKSNRAKADIGNMLSGSVGHPCSVQISIDIPTRERSTEVTESLEKAVPKFEDNTSVSIEEIDRSVGEGDAPQMTIAVNTDPLGLLALLRISKEAMKQLLSYVPNIPYHSYIWSMINFPQTSEPRHYICNICGAAFRRPSQLSDHIQGHGLAKTRDCCVCRHMIDMQRHRAPGLFRCQYCGQRFTRAYCCELHQESCARRLGTRHDVSPSLMILR